jgi:signal transduction histidine kinase
MRLPLRRQILLPMVGIVLLTIGVVSALNAWLASQRVQRHIESQLVDVQRTLSAGNFPLESNVLRQMRGLTGAEYVVAGESGAFVAASHDRFMGLSVDGYQRRALAIDRRPVGGGRLVLHAFYPETALRQAQWQAVWPPLAIGALAVLLVGAAAYFVAQRVTQPVQQLHAQVQRIAEGDFHPAPIPSRDDEIRDLVAAVNQMAAKLARYEEDTRASERLKTLGTLGAGIAHQIRNAATGCRIALDLHLRDCPSASTNGDDETPLGVAMRQLAQIESHIQRFLALGKPAPRERQPVEVSDVAREAAALVEPMAAHLGVEIVRGLEPQSLTVMGDRDSLVQMLVNLLVNAVEAAAKVRVEARGGSAVATIAQVELTAGRTASGLALAVVDPGPGPAPAIAPRLFQPFATDKPGGTGLGLVVSRKIAEDHGGRLSWRREDERTWFVVELPLRAA